MNESIKVPRMFWLKNKFFDQKNLVLIFQPVVEIRVKSGDALVDFFLKKKSWVAQYVIHPNYIFLKKVGLHAGPFKLDKPSCAWLFF